MSRRSKNMAGSYIKIDRKPPVRQPQPRHISRQKLRTRSRNEVYLALRDVYLEENPACVRCNGVAEAVHHVVRGTAGRARSLLNSDSWLGVCHECHDLVERLTPEQQIRLKQKCVRRTIERLRA